MDSVPMITRCMEQQRGCEDSNQWEAERPLWSCEHTWTAYNSNAAITGTLVLLSVKYTG